MLARHPARRGHLIAILAAMAVVVAACGGSSNDSGGSSSGGSSASVVSGKSTKECPGAPLRFTSIVSLSGPISLPSLATETKDGTNAALEAVNKECKLGRPIDLVICDDKGDPNQATQCGREAKSNGSIALLGSSGLYDTGTTAADMPGVMTGGATVFDLTDKRSFAALSLLTLVVGGSSASAAAGAKHVIMVAVDSGASRQFIQIAKQVASNLGMTMDAIFVPATTTDWAPIAAQVSERHPDAIGLAVATVVPFMNALNAEGITPDKTPIMTAVTLFPPEVVKELGSKADGVYLVTQTAPPSDTSNPGIKEMLADLKAAGIKVDPNKLSPAITNAWSDIRILVDDILAKAPKSEIASLDADTLVKIFEQTGPISRPEYAPFDFHKNAYPDIPALSTLRLYSREAMVVQVENGKYKRISGFSDATKPFHIETS
jgi:ABC-type branched-subunit amino acid transport system substrate-binding protein